MVDIRGRGLKDKVQSLKDEQEKVQKKTFTKWINSYLCQLKPPVIIKDLMVDFKDGLLLLNLLELLTNTTLPKEMPKNMQRIHCITNIKTALEFMENDRKIKMVNINPSDVVDGKPAIVLGLVWKAILHFQIEEQEEFLLLALGLENDSKANMKGQARKGLMAWTNKGLSDKYGINIKDFGDSWSDGRAFNAMVHNIDPTLIDMDDLENKTNKERLQNAFNVAESELGIPKLLDVEDVDIEKPDEKSIMTYVAQFLKSYPECQRTEEMGFKINRNEMTEMSPPNDLDIVRKFVENVNKNTGNPQMKNNYDIFAELMNQKSDVEATLENLDKEANLDIDVNELEQARFDLQKTNAQLKEWQWNLDKNLPGILGSEIGQWLQEAEKCLLEPFPDCENEDFNEKIFEKLKTHEKIFDKKNNILGKFNEIFKCPPSGISPEQLESMRMRINDVIKDESKAREKLNLFALPAKLKDKERNWNNHLDLWNAPIDSKTDFDKRMKDFNEITDNGNSLDIYTGQLDDLIKKRAKFCKENPDFDPKLFEFLNRSIIECEEEHDIFPEKFDAARETFESLSTKWDEINSAEQKIETFLQKLENSLKTNDLHQQKFLVENLPEISDLLNDMKRRVQEDLISHSSQNLVQSMAKEIADYEEKLEKMGAEVVNRLETQEKEMAKKQEAAQQAVIENMVVNSEADVKNVTDWLKELENCFGSTVSGSSENLENTKKSLENLDSKSPEIQKLLSQGYQAVIELRKQKAPEQADKIKKVLDDLQNKFSLYKEIEIPKTFDMLNNMIGLVKDVEKGIDNLDKLVSEGEYIKNNLENPSNVDETVDIIRKEKEFVGKEKEIVESIRKDKEKLKKLKELSAKTPLNIDLMPLEEKISTSENCLRELLKDAEKTLSATDQCNKACKNANNCLNGLSDKIQNEIKFSNDEDGQKAKLANIENMKQELNKAEELIKEALTQRDSSLPYLAKSELEKVDKQISQMKRDANEVKDKLDKSKSELGKNLNTWKDFKKAKDVADSDFANLVNDLQACHDKHNGLHGGSCDDKASLLKENKERLKSLESQEAEIVKLMEISKKLGSEKPLIEVQNLKKNFEKQKEDLKKEIEQNAKDLENHKQFENDLDSFSDWLKDAEKLALEIEKLPTNKEGLIEKQKLLGELDNLKSAGNKKLKDLKNLQNLVLNETAVNERDKINSNIKDELDRFDTIFGKLDNRDDVNETIEKLENIGENSDAVSETLSDINKKLEKCLSLPSDSISEKEKIGKELKNLDNFLNQQRAQIQDLKIQCESLKDSAAVEELVEKLAKMEDQCNAMEDIVNENIASKKNEMEQQAALEKQLNVFADLMNETEEEMTSAMPPENSKEAIEESLQRLQKLKSQYLPGKEILENIIKSRNDFNVPKHCVEACENSEQKYFDIEDEIKNMEKKLEMQKNDWSNYNSIKNGVENVMDTVSDQIGKEHDLHHGIHGGDVEEKQVLLNGNKKRLEDLNNQEEEINELFEIAKKLGSDKSLSEAQNIKKKFQKQREELEKEIRQNEKDLENHQQFENDLDSFKDWLKEAEHIAKIIQELPNNKEGLVEKQKRLEELENLKTVGNRKLKDLKNLQKVVLDETAPNHDDEINSIIDKESDRFNDIFGHLDLQSDINETIEKLESIGENSDAVFESMEDIKAKLLRCENLPNDTVGDKEKVGKELKSLDRLLDQQKAQLKNLANQCESLKESAALEDVVARLKNMEEQCNAMKEVVNNKLADKEKEIKIQAALEDKLNAFVNLMDETEEELNHLIPSENNETVVEKSLKKLKKLKSQYSPGKEILENIVKSRTEFEVPKQCAELCNESEQRYFDIEDAILNLEKKLELQKNDWNDYNLKKADVENGINKITDQLQDVHNTNKGIHGGSCTEKTSLLDENLKRLDDLNHCDEQISKLLEMAEKLESDKPLLDVQNLKKKIKKVKEDLEQEIKQNKEDLENHKQFDKALDSFRDLLKEAEKLSKRIETLPNDKEGLIEKHKLLVELNNLKSPASSKEKDLKNLQSVVSSETAPDKRAQINSSVDIEIDKFNRIFNNSNHHQDDIKETIEKLENMDQKSDEIFETINAIEAKLEQCSDFPDEEITDKEKLSKELKSLDREIDQQKSEINDLKSQSKSLENNTAVLDFLKKLRKLEEECNSIKEGIDQKIIANDNDLRHQTALERKLNDFETLMNRTVEEINNCSANGCNEAGVEESIKKLKKIKEQHSKGKEILKDIMKTIDLFKAPTHISETSETSEQRYSDIEDKISKLESKLETQKADWSNFNTEKDDLDKWLDTVSGNMEKLEKKNPGTHAGKIPEKEQLLDNHRKLLQDVLNHEADIKTFIDRSTPLLNESNQETPKRVTNNLCKKYEKLLESLTNTVQQNEEDLDKHENYKAEMDHFIEENKTTIKSISEEISKLPNSKEGMKRKIEVYDNLKDLYNERKVLLVELEKLKNDVIDHSSPKIYQDLEQQWDQMVDNFEKSFNPSMENQSKLLAAVHQIEKTEIACQDFASKLSAIQERQNAIISHPISSIEDIENKLQSLKDLRYELKEFQTPINELNRKRGQIPNDVESAKQNVDGLLDQFKSLNESITSNLNECDNQYKQLSNMSSSLTNFKAWLDHTANQIDDRSKITNLDVNSLKKNLNSLKILRDDIAEHKVDLSRLQNTVDSFMKISNDNSLQHSLDELSEEYHSIHSRCQSVADQSDQLIRLMNKYENSRANVLHWIESNTQTLLKCSDYTLNQSQIKSKLMMIENLEKDFENNGQFKFIEAIQDGEELMNELTGIPKQLIEQQSNDLKSDWAEISRQLNHLSNNLKNTTSRSEAFKEMSSRLSTWLDDMEHTGFMDPSSIEHHCEMSQEDNSPNNKCDRIKTLLIEIDRHKPDFIQLSSMAADLANPSFDIENSQIQNRFNRLHLNLKDKVEILSKHQADYDKVKQDIEEMEKWIFQTSIKIINENAEQGNNTNSSSQDIDGLIQHSDEIIKSVLAKESELSKIHQSADFLNNSDNQSPEKDKELEEDLEKLDENFNNLKESAIHKRDHLIDSMKKWDNYNNFLQSTRAFLDNEMDRWWKDKSSIPTKNTFSPKDNEYRYKEILEMENKLNGLKKEMEKVARDCDGIVPTVSAALSRSTTPNFKSSRSSSLNSTNPFTNKQPGHVVNETQEPNGLSKSIYDELENNLKKLSELKKESQNKSSDWNNFNREKTCFKNWLDNEKMKITSTLQSSPGMTNLESFQKNKLKVILEEMDHKKPVLSNLNERFMDLTANTPGATDATLRDMTREFEAAEKQINQLLNREDKEVEANFTEDESNLDIIQERIVPKLNLNPILNKYEPPDNLNRFTQTIESRDHPDYMKSKSSNSANQTPITKTTQTHFKEISNYGTQTIEKPHAHREKREEKFFKILNSIKDINAHLESARQNPELSFSHTPTFSSTKPRSPNQESIRRNMIPSNSHVYPSIKKPITPRYDFGLSPQRTQTPRPHSQSSSKRMSLLSNPNLTSFTNGIIDFYIPTKDKFHDLEFQSQRSGNPLSNSQLDIPKREFQIDFNSHLKSPKKTKHHRNGDSSHRTRNNSDSGRTSVASKNSRINESLNRINQDANELRNLSEKLRNY